MMTGYEAVLEGLNLPIDAQRCARGEIRFPVPDIEVPFGSYGFPPALIPLWSRGSGPEYYGFWIHWFVDRKPTLVRVEITQGYLVQEIARTFEQLASLIVLEAIVMRDGVSPEIETFAHRCGVDLNAIDAISQESGDDASGLLQLASFAEQPPANLLVTGVKYEGDFPFAGMEATPERLRTICTLETPIELRSAIAAMPKAPAWFLTDSEPTVFYSALERADFAEAWMSLNSAGWKFSDAKIALRALSEVAGDDRFRKVASAWIEQPHEWVENY